MVEGIQHYHALVADDLRCLCARWGVALAVTGHCATRLRVLAIRDERDARPGITETSFAKFWWQKAAGPPLRLSPTGSQAPVQDSLHSVRRTNHTGTVSKNPHGLAMLAVPFFVLMGYWVGTQEPQS